MAYPEKRGGKLTGFWCGEVDQRHKGGPRFRARFETRKAAVGYEAYIKATGEAPPWLTDTAGSGLTFAAVAKECEDAGGPAGAWKRDRDASIFQRLKFLRKHKLGAKPIEQVATADLLGLVTDLEKRPGKRKGTKLSPGSVNRYLTAASAVFTYAVQKHTKAKPYIEKAPNIPWRREPKQGRFWWLTEAQEANVVGTLVQQGHHVEAACVRFLSTRPVKTTVGAGPDGPKVH